MVAAVEAAAAELGMQTALAWDAAGVARVVTERAGQETRNGARAAWRCAAPS